MSYPYMKILQLLTCCISQVNGLTIYYHYLEGENAQLQWTLSPPVQDPIVFVYIKNPAGVNILLTRGTVYAGLGKYADRVVYTGDTTKSNMNFTLINVVKSDAGAYNANYDNQDYAGATLVIYVKPNQASITSSIVPVLERNLVLHCTSQSNSVPAKHDLVMSYTWFINGVELPKDDRFVVTNKQLTVKDIQRSDKGSKITCKAEETPTLPSDASSEYTIDPEFGPLNLRLNPTTTSYSPAQGTRLGPIACSAECKPSCSYQWSYNGNTISQASSVLDIPSIQRVQTGTYICKANNKHGEKMANVTVSVLYSPLINRFVSNPIGPDVDENSTVYFVCEIKGYPVPVVTIYFEWNSTIHKKDETLSTTLMLKNVSCLQSGYYVCNAINEVGSITIKSSLNVLCSPRLDYRKKIEVNHRIGNGEVVNITGIFIANPQPTFTWKFRRNSSEMEKVLKNDTESFYYINQKNDYISYGSYAIRNITEEKHVGQYILEASNKIGSAILVQTVFLIRPPDPPIGIAAVCTSVHTAEVMWISKYNGGSNQHFRIGIKTSNDTMYTEGEKIMDPGENGIARRLVHRLKDDTSYLFTVYAENKYGKSMTAVNLECVTPVKVTCQAEPNTASVILIILSTVLMFGFIIGISIQCVLKSRRGIPNNRHERSSKDDFKEQKELDSINVYHELGEREQPIDTAYQELQESKTGTKVDSNKGNVYDSLGQQNPPNVYEKLNTQAKKKSYC